MEQWSARQLAKEVGVPLSTLANWISTGLIQPDEYGRGRRGHRIGLSGLLELLAVKELRDAHIPVQQIHRVVSHLRQMTGHTRPLAPVVLVVVGDDVIVQDLEDPLMAVSTLRHPGQRMMVFPIGEKHAQMLDGLREANRTNTAESIGERPTGRIPKKSAPKVKAINAA